MSRRRVAEYHGTGRVFLHTHLRPENEVPGSFHCVTAADFARHRQGNGELGRHSTGSGEGVRRVGLSADRRAVTEVPGVGDGLAVRIARTAAAELNGQPASAIILVRGRNRNGIPVAGVRELPDRTGVTKRVTDIIEAPVERMLHYTDNSAAVTQEVPQGERSVILIKSQVLDDSLAPISKKIRVLVLCWERCSRVPSATNGAIAAERRFP